jgi:hypothetical protein
MQQSWDTFNFNTYTYLDKKAFLKSKLKIMILYWVLINAVGRMNLYKGKKSFINGCFSLHCE